MSGFTADAGTALDAERRFDDALRAATGHLDRSGLPWALIGGVASIALTTAAEKLVLPLLPSGWQPIALTLSYLAASGPVFLAKFAIFDRVFASRTRTYHPLPTAATAS